MRFLILSLFMSITVFSHTAENSTDFKIGYLPRIPSKDVNCIFYDSKGFTWIGTLDGLHRFDGYSYKTYRVDNNRNSIHSNLIIAIDEDSKGNIWIGTYGKGVCKLNPETDELTSYENVNNDPDGLPNDITSLIIDDKDFLWTANWFGICRIKFDAAMNNVTQFNRIPISVRNRNNNYAIKTIFQDKNNNIWVGSNLFTLRLKNPYSQPEKVEMEYYSCYSESICDFENGILVGGYELNAIVKNANVDTFKIHHLSSIISGKVLYDNHKIWIGNRAGIFCLEQGESDNWETTRHLKKDFSELSLNSNIITSITNDNVGQIWIGSRGGGVNIINSVSKQFQHYKHTLNRGSIASDLAMCMFEDSYQNLWIGTEESGVSILQSGGDYASGFKHIVVNNFPNENRVYAVEETQTPGSKSHKSIIWTGTSHPTYLTAYNPVTLEEIKLSAQTKNIGHVFALENQDDSILWVGTYGQGLWRLTLDNQGNIANMRNFTPDSPSGKGLLSFIIRNIFRDSKGNIWISTDKGINRISKFESVKDQPYFEAFTIGKDESHLSHDYVLQIIESRNGNIWIGTMGGGMIRFNDNLNGKYSFTTVTSNDGLPNNTIKTIVEDNEGILWLASNKGLTKYNPVDGNIMNYDVDDGLQDNDFSEICGLKRKNNEIIFGGINGFNVFKSEILPIDKIKPRLYFTEFQILNKNIKVDDLVDNKKILKKTIEYTKEIELDYNHNSFTIGFVGIQYHAPQKHNYRYILEGFDKEWYKASADYRYAKYTNIPDGVYTFKVMGSNSDNIWTDEPIELTIRIKPPGYRSPLALFIYFVVLIITLIVITKAVKEVAQRKRDVLVANMEKDRIEEISRLKLQFFTNISHEFKTPLTLLSSPLDLLIREGESTFSKNQLYNLNLIKHNAGIMIRLVNQILDFRKLDQNKLQLQPSRQSLNEFLRNIYTAFEVLAKQKNISYNFYPYKGGDDIWIDVDKMEKVVYNLLSNAFKYTQENGRIVMFAEADLDSNQFVIKVSDTGIGIDKNEEIHIFERYYQSENKNKRNISGTGIGLALAKGFVDLHKGEIGFYPNSDEGTVFYVKLRMGNAHFPREMLAEPQALGSFVAPEYHSPKEDMPEESPTALKADLNKMLVVEDNYDLRKQVKNIFRNQYVVFEAEDGIQGLELCKKEQPDIVVTDVMMPKMDGIELCNRIKSDEEISHIPVMLLTAKNTDETIVEGYEFGADGYVAKPFNIDVLVARVNSLVKIREQLKNRFQKEIQINPNIISNTPADSKFMDIILGFIEKNLSEPGYNVEQLSVDYGVSRIYLNKKIKALTGETSSEFIRNIKLKHAAEFLKQNKLNVSEVAWEVGYSDIRTFRKRFKEKFDLSPSDFAKQYK